MTRSSMLRLAAVALAVLALPALGVWRITDARADADRDADHEPPAASVAVLAGGGAVLTVDRAAQVRAGIEVGPLPAATAVAQTRAYATVLDPARVAALADADGAAQAQLQAAAARAVASRQTLERTRLLYADDQNDSLAQEQTAEAASRADAAAVAAAQAQAQSAHAAAASELGPVLAGARGRAALGALIAGRSVLVQVTLPPGVIAPRAPTEAQLQTADGARVSARLLDAAPRVDPKLQAPSFYYLAPATSGLPPGMNVTALLPRGAPQSAAAVPASAVVSWGGESWVYVRTGPERFQRVEIATDTPTPDGGYVTAALAPGTMVVTRGAQLLLSEELRPQPQAEADED